MALTDKTEKTGFPYVDPSLISLEEVSDFPVIDSGLIGILEPQTIDYFPNKYVDYNINEAYREFLQYNVKGQG